MAQAKGYKEIKSAWSNGLTKIEVTYDFAQDGGAQGTFDLLKLGFAAIIRAFYAKTVTTMTSGGAPVIDVGVKGGDTDSLMDGLLKTDFVAGGVKYDGAAQIIPQKIEANGEITMTVGTADLTAGKVIFVFEVEKYFAE